MEEFDKVDQQALIIGAWRLDKNISAEKYVDAIDKLILLSKKAVFEEIDGYRYHDPNHEEVFITPGDYARLKERMIGEGK